MAYMLGVSLLTLLVVLYDWPRIQKNQVKERAVFTTLTLLGWLILLLVKLFPNMPGTTQLITAIYKPLSAMLN
ncbi:hypothetical protein [Paenibacillus sacheonensis]|uniref:Uncharacterized protein n=1 Tax=Paenibacillus sacheonensis TaxID=742054 RepID=A0A7X5C0M9_9BACL|nr:hypothetical protein [Paenibacillus sacheonensis]MBM7564887.1 hypothetical protein [Paenibacillus sacheonensis]NBC69435.1 hypothetical protein [Paenibacillus sacheonensis]